MPDIRLDPRIEAAAYFVIAEATLRASATKATVRVDRIGDRLMVDVDADGPGPASMVGLEDRIGALDGTVSIRFSSGGRHAIHAEIPCGS